MDPKQLGVDISINPGIGLIEMIAGYQGVLMGLTAVFATLAISIYVLQATVLPGRASERLEAGIGGMMRVCVLMMLIMGAGSIASWLAGIGDASPYIGAAIG